VEPDPKTQLRVTFESLGSLPPEVLSVVMSRREEAAALLAKPYDLPTEAAPKKRKARKF
jgi:hypothetical protein